MSGLILRTLRSAVKSASCGQGILGNCPARLSSTVKTQFLPRNNEKVIAYRQLEGENPGIIFCPGFQSTMEGVKATALEQYCRAKKLSYVRFDYQGCGQSSGDLKDVTLTDWRGDIMAILDQITAGPQIIVGSSMGGLLMLHTALERPHRIHALVGIATSSQFPKTIKKQIPPEVMKDVDLHGVAVHEQNGMNSVISQRLLDDLPNHDLLSKCSSYPGEVLPIKCPVHLLHGMQDQSTHYSNSIDLADKLWTEDVQLVFSKSGDHRFSQLGDVQLLFETLDLLIFGLKEVRNLAIESWSSFTLFPQPDHLVTKEKVLKKY